MIQRLSIKNYAIIEQLEMEFSEGLTIITGETGAGKSILLGALGLIMGKRADTKTLYEEDQKCIIEGTFDIAKYNLQFFFENEELDHDTELIVRREISPSGKSRAFVNDTPVKLKVLQNLSAELIDLHQQFDTLDLNEVSFQLKMLDALAENKALLQKYQKAYRQYQRDKKQLADLEEQNRNATKEAEFIAFQLNELEEATLEVGEQDLLEEEQNRLNNAEGIKKALGTAYMTLVEQEQSVIGQLEEINVQMHPFREVDGKLNQLNERLDAVTAELEDLSRELEDVAESIEYNPQRIEEIQSRLDQIYRLQKKHFVNDIEGLLNVQQELQSQTASLEDLEEQIQGLKKSIDTQEGKLIELAKKLSERRKSVVKSFENKVRDRLSLLAMEHARMEVSFQVLKDFGPSGWDEVHFLFAANKGSKLQEIKDVASGGELSRLALVTKSLVASAIPLPTLIFDEIDTGISGDVALKMGNILRTLSDEHQVVCITHSPQIASKADSHFFVYKKVKTDRTITKVKSLEPGEPRVHAIATMLSQDPPSTSALENAKDLIRKK
ncbi:MAG: DNA repair protein RecN [Saprospiraceae bacterium]